MTRPVRTPFVRDGTLGRDWDGTFDAKPSARRQTGRAQVRRDWDGTRGFATGRFCPTPLHTERRAGILNIADALQSARSALYDRVRSITRKPAEWVGQSVSNITDILKHPPRSSVLSPTIWFGAVLAVLTGVVAVSGAELSIKIWIVALFTAYVVFFSAWAAYLLIYDRDALGPIGIRSALGK